MVALVHLATRGSVPPYDMHKLVLGELKIDFSHLNTNRRNFRPILLVPSTNDNFETQVKISLGLVQFKNSGLDTNFH